MIWTNKQIKQHKVAAKKLNTVKAEVFRLLKQQPTINEYQVVQFILQQYKKYKLKTDHHSPIVAFRQNTAHVHYFPSPYCLKLQPNSIILLDLWARVNEPGAPFADMTWMAFSGKSIPSNINKIFTLVIGARDQAIALVRVKIRQGKLPSGYQVDQAARDLIDRAGYSKNFPHSTGHSLGKKTPHGSSGRISPKNNSLISKRLGYTIEPGVYLPNKFGVRSEIDFYIDVDNKMIITTSLQKELTKIV